jgi:hypothetical protein
VRNPVVLARCALVSVAIIGLSACGGENSNEKLARRVTEAVMENDMRPVASEFNAIVRPKLENRETVGRLSDNLRPLGRLKRVKETTRNGERTGRHTFDVEFDNGIQNEDMTLDSEGKIAGFHIRTANAEPSP